MNMVKSKIQILFNLLNFQNLEILLPFWQEKYSKKSHDKFNNFIPKRKSCHMIPILSTCLKWVKISLCLINKIIKKDPKIQHMEKYWQIIVLTRDHKDFHWMIFTIKCKRRTQWKLRNLIRISSQIKIY